MVDGECYRRTISLDGQSGHFEARLGARSQTLDLRIQFPEPRALFRIVEGARRLFDLSADPVEVAAHLRRDAMLARRVGRRPGLRVPGAWDRFELAVRAVLGQQVTVKGASTLAGRIARTYGTAIDAGAGLTHLFPEPHVLADADFAKIGLPRARAATLRALAQAAAAGEIRFSGLADPNALTALPGVGNWTAQYIAMRAFGEPDAFPASDLGLLRATGLKSHRELEQRAERWRPWRAYAAMYLWQGGN
jgi:3-methyladenine DNA glycosylase/8-oxoguanine DNA glycosylase